MQHPSCHHPVGRQLHEGKTREDDEGQKECRGLRYERLGNGPTGLPHDLKADRQEQVEAEQHGKKPGRPTVPRPAKPIRKSVLLGSCPEKSRVVRDGHDDG
jgi:hypothetical protein